MNTLTAIIMTLVLGTSIIINTATTTGATDGATYIGPPATTTTAGDTVAPVGPPATFDGRGTPTCLSCKQPGTRATARH
jgi:hypothetical protein